MLVVVIVVGLIYALPNLYGEDPAVQITGARGVAASEQTLIQVQKTLQEEKITAKSVALEEGAILARFDTTDTQLLSLIHIFVQPAFTYQCRSDYSCLFFA